MKYMVTVDGDKKETDVLKKTVSEVIAHLSEEYWDTKYFERLEEGKDYFQCDPLVDFACCDVTLQGATALLQELRRFYDEMGLLLIADERLSPLEYLKPGIRADSLLLRPYDRETLRLTLMEFIREGLARKEQNVDEDSFVMETKEGKTYISYDKIYYFEAREKKIFVRLLHEEYGFYSTIEELEGMLPARFNRCHRSYIINTDKIKRTLLSQNMIELESEFAVPLSRSYKHKFKG